MHPDHTVRFDNNDKISSSVSDNNRRQNPQPPNPTSTGLLYKHIKHRSQQTKNLKPKPHHQQNNQLRGQTRLLTHLELNPPHKLVQLPIPAFPIDEHDQTLPQK